MDKYLLSSDYWEVIMQGCKLPKIDHPSHFLNFADQHFKNNPDLFEKLRSTVTDIIKWFKEAYNNRNEPENPVEWSIDGESEFYILLYRADGNIKVTEGLINRQLSSIEIARERNETSNTGKLKSGSKTKNEKLNTILDIWLPDKYGTKKEYYKMIKRLTSERVTDNEAFLTEKDNKLYWTTCYGKFQYLFGLIYTCINKGWIKKGHSAPLYRKILNNTFNAETGSSTTFKGIDSNPPAEHYVSLFKYLPYNK